ncbi:hypothetical protein [Paracraurococcus ruber]|uniref:hypothetical protein n=1 Tax=Paracraurococcus ruber TaxID=77675 RepID=UPI001057EB5F|nr:hypothetical protein [Paracraurococcus ruber]TDG16844.1 hypothetical protein E2C05_28885 [Paracraurococcus ruber]
MSDFYSRVPSGFGRLARCPVRDRLGLCCLPLLSLKSQCTSEGFSPGLGAVRLFKNLLKAGPQAGSFALGPDRPFALLAGLFRFLVGAVLSPAQRRQEHRGVPLACPIR